MAKFARKCPNCGQITDGDDCDWCKFPIRPLRVKSDQRILEAGEHVGADKQTGIMVIEKAASDLEEAKKALEAEIAGWERFQQEEEARKAAEAKKTRITTDAEETFKAEAAGEVIEVKETGIAAEVKKAATVELDEKLTKMVTKREAIIKAQLDKEQVKNPEDANIITHSTTGYVTPVVAEFIRKRVYRKIVEPLLSLPITRTRYRMFKEYLETIENINRELSNNKIGTEEAIKRLREMTPMEMMLG